MEDYKELMKDLLLQYYSPIPSSAVKQLYTSNIQNWFSGVIPTEPICENDVF